MFKKYSDMKEEAERFLLIDDVCSQRLNPVILKPGLIYNSHKRGWLFPVKVATDMGYTLNKKVVSRMSYMQHLQEFFPQSSSTDLNKLTDIAVLGALGELKGMPEKKIWLNEEF
jgi:hypothetical protein